MMEHQLPPTLTEIPPVAPVINGEPMHPMESSHLGTTFAAQYSTNYSQMITYPKRSPRWSPCPQYWIQQIILVQVNPGETLTIKSDDGTIQNIQGPADVPLMSPSGTLPPIYLPPGYMSQVIEENGIRKIIIVPQTIDYHTTMPAPIQPISHFITPPSFIYPSSPQLMFPPVQGEFPLPFFQEPVPQQLPPPLPPPPATFIYQEHQEISSHGRVNYNQFDEKAAKIGDYMKKKLRERQVGGHRNNYMVTSNSFVVNKTDDVSSVSDTLGTSSVNSALTSLTAYNTSSTDSVDSPPSTCTVDSTSSTSPMDSAPCTHTVDDTPSPHAVDSALSIDAADDIPTTDIIDDPPVTHSTDKTPSSSPADHAPSQSASANTLDSATTESAAGPSCDGQAPTPTASEGPSTTDSLPSSSLSESTPNTSISENVPCISATDGALGPSANDNAPCTSNAAGTPNTARAQGESSHAKKQNATGGGDNKQESGGKQNKSQSSDAAEKECKTEQRKPCCFIIEKPVVSDIQTRSAVISWNLHGSEKCDHTKSPVIFELAVSNSGKNGKFKNIYIGDEVTFTLLDLQPSMAYYIRVTTVKGSEHRTKSEVIGFTTPGCKPDPPLAPKLINRSKSSLNLQWKGSNDNGSKINSFLLEWDEGKGEQFKSCYMGTMKQHKILKLNASTKYSFRLAAKNNFGLSDFSEIAAFHTSGTMPPTPSPPKLKEAGICSLALEWRAPANTNPNDSLTYVLEMEESGSGLGFKPKYNGEDLSCTVQNLQRSTAYKFRIFAYNMEGRSNPSGEVKYTTCPDKPGPPQKPYIKGKIHPHRVKIGWESPKDNGGTYISSYSLEVSVNSDENVWDTIYSGTTKEFLYDQLKPDTTYKLRVLCTSPIGKSQPSDILTIQTATLSPESCQPSSINGKTNHNENNLQSDNSTASEAPEHVKNAEGNQGDTTEPPGAEASCTLGSDSMKCETPPVIGPPSQCGTPVLTCKGPTCVVVSWEIPQSNGAEITDYRLEWGPIEESMHLIYTGPCLRYEVKGLIPATTYFCRVQAVNIAGVGMFGGTSMVTTPATVPAVVPMLHEVENKLPAKLAASCLALQWEEPDCHGSPVTGYNIEYGDRKILTVARVTECILKNLQPDTTYKVRIQAINHYGLSPFSQSIRIKTKPLPPEPPHLDCVVYGHQSLKLKWGNTSNKKLLSSLISYNLLMGDRSGRFSVIYHGPCQTHKVQRLGEYTQYKFKIQACNEAGEGPLSGIYTFTTTKTPPATLKAPKLHQMNSNICEIKWESLEPMKGDPIIYNLQLISEKGTELIYKGPNTSFSFSNFLTNSHYRFKVCAGRQYQNAAGLQELWGPYSPSTLFSTQKQPGHGKGGGGKRGNNPSEEKEDKLRIELSDDTFVLILLIGFALVAILCAVVIQHFLIN